MNDLIACNEMPEVLPHVEPSPALAFDRTTLVSWLIANVPDFGGPLRIEQFRGGQSNPTYRLRTPARDYVLRRKPSGILVKGAHAVDREFKVLRALGQARYPVPQVYAICLDDSVFDTPFYVMEMVQGRIFWDAALLEVSGLERRHYFRAMNTTLADLHRMVPSEWGLTDFGRPERYFERQIKRWSGQYLSDPLAGRDAFMDRLLDWLPKHIPAGDESSIIHGDFRLDNVMFHPSEPSVIAVLDWELSTLGHPLADFTYHLMMYRLPPELPAGLRGADLAALGIPSEAEYIEEYCARSGRDGIGHLQFYLSFNLFRLAAIVHGIKGRIARGTAISSQAHAMAKQFEMLAELAWDHADGA